jgi:hypothetical protein
MSGSEGRSLLRKRSKTSEWRSGSIGPMPSRYATSEFAAEPLPGPREAHEVPDDQEVVRQPGLCYHPQLVLELPRRSLAHRAVAGEQPVSAQPCEIAVSVAAGRGGKDRQVLQAERELVCAARGDGERVLQRLALEAEQRGEAAVGLEVALVVGVQLGGEPGERHAPANGGERVLEALAVAAGVVDVVGGHCRQPEVAGEAVQVVHERDVVGAQVVLQLHVEPAGKQPGEVARDPKGPLALPGEQCCGQRPAPAAGQADQTLAPAVEGGPGQRRLALGRLVLGQRDQLAQVAPALLAFHQ